MTIPPLSDEQRSQAREAATAARRHRAEVKRALRNGEAPRINGGTVARSLEPTNTNGNNVNLDAETLIATETGLRYQLALNALDGKYNSIRTALRTQ